MSDGGANEREHTKDADAQDPLSDANSHPPSPPKKKKKKKHTADKEAEIVVPAPAVCGEGDKSKVLTASINQDCSAKPKKKRKGPLVVEGAPSEDVEESAVLVGEIPSAVNGTGSCPVTAENRGKHKAVVRDDGSTAEESTAAGEVFVPSGREEVEVDNQSGPSSGIMVAEDMAEKQAHESQKTGEVSEHKHKKKKKARSKEVVIDLVGSSGPSEGCGGMGPVRVAEEEVAGSHSEKRKSKKRHKKEVASDHDHEEASHESKAKRKKTKVAAPQDSP